MRVLAGDIGGTKTLLRIAECDAGRCRSLREQRFDSGAYDSLGAVVHDFLRGGPRDAIAAACFGVAGPVTPSGSGERVKVTNLPWEIDSLSLAAEFGIPQVRLINDFQAIGYGIEALEAQDLVVLQPGEPVLHGPRAVIGAGTGLGQGILVWDRDHYEPIATEGGHASFGPEDELQLELARYLLKNCGRASYERVLSGHGLVRLYAFFRERGETPESPPLAQAMRQSDPAAAITRAALQDNDPLATRALELFVEIYGAQAGNLALTAGATGGVYVAGGIAPKILPRLTDGRFLRAFCNKGKMAPYVAAIPLQIVLNPQVGLAGASRVAGRLASARTSGQAGLCR
jgi:glucokinase